ncbi:MAG: hypothetical protein KTR31_12455 [Myxococcales bacterium]|nr:hypothetical protein [Myxococcales bacterium]
MGFLFDSLRHLLASDPKARRAALASMLGRVLGAEAVQLRHPSLSGEADFQVWHARKASGRPFAVTWTVGLAEAQQRELVALTLADTHTPSQDRMAGLLAAVAEADVAELVALPEGCLGRSSHTFAVVGPEVWALYDHAEYERILGASMQLVVPVTPREAEWVRAQGAQAYLAAMREQQVGPWADRAPGEVQLPRGQGA